MAVGGVRKLEAENLGVLACLLYAGFCRQPDFLGFDHGKGIVPTVVQQVIRALLFATANLATGHNDAAIGESTLLANSVWSSAPARLNQSGGDEFAAGIRFGDHAISHCLPLHRVVPQSIRILKLVASAIGSISRTFFFNSTSP